MYPSMFSCFLDFHETVTVDIQISVVKNSGPLDYKDENVSVGMSFVQPFNCFKNAFFTFRYYIVYIHILYST